jgi:hypothetical protein
MRKDRIFVLLLVLLLPMTGCFGDVVGDAQADDDDDDDDVDWINDVGTSTTTWTLNLTSSQWLEVKSAAGLYERFQGNQSSVITQTGMAIQENGGWELTSNSYSPVFGGTYTMCVFFVEDDCYNSDPDGDWQLSQWSIIYRIHPV